MKHIFKKPMGLAAAIALTLGGLSMATTASAAAKVSVNNGGDLALVPYYTARNGFVSGVHITNTTDKTQIVKFRMRRGSDSNDAIDFIIGLSPHDMFTGWIDKDAAGNVRFNTDDNSCTAPMNVNGLLFPSDLAGNNIVPKGGDEGYIEVIAMGQPIDELQPVARYALHNNGTPADCAKFGANFLAPRISLNGSATGVINSSQTANLSGPFNSPATTSVVTNYRDTPANALRVSYFIRHRASGLEFGNSAVHIEDFAQLPMMANQQYGVHDFGKFISGIGNLTAAQTLAGFEFPNLDGGSTQNGGTNGLFNTLRAVGVLGTVSISNDWSINPVLGSTTDWTVTFPGQYLMRGVDQNLTTATNDDLPVSANITVWDREEGTAPPRGLVVSPNYQVADTATLPNEVNVIEWFGGSVLGSNNARRVTTQPGSTFTPVKGWSEFALTSAPGAKLVFDHARYPAETTSAATGRVPTIGFTAWQRTFKDPAKNYGRIIEHGRGLPQG